MRGPVVTTQMIYFYYFLVGFNAVIMRTFNGIKQVKMVQRQQKKKKKTPSIYARNPTKRELFAEKWKRARRQRDAIYLLKEMLFAK